MQQRQRLAKHKQTMQLPCTAASTGRLQYAGKGMSYSHACWPSTRLDTLDYAVTKLTCTSDETDESECSMSDWSWSRMGSGAMMNLPPGRDNCMHTQAGKGGRHSRGHLQ